MAKPNEAQGSKRGYKDDYGGFYPNPGSPRLRSENPPDDSPIYIYIVHSARYPTHAYRSEVEAKRYADGVLQAIITKVELR